MEAFFMQLSTKVIRFLLPSYILVKFLPERIKWKYHMWGKHFTYANADIGGLQPTKKSTKKATLSQSNVSSLQTSTKEKMDPEAKFFLMYGAGVRRCHTTDKVKTDLLKCLTSSWRETLMTSWKQSWGKRIVTNDEDDQVWPHFREARRQLLTWYVQFETESNPGMNSAIGG